MNAETKDFIKWIVDHGKLNAVVADAYTRIVPDTDHVPDENGHFNRQIAEYHPAIRNTLAAVLSADGPRSSVDFLAAADALFKAWESGAFMCGHCDGAVWSAHFSKTNINRWREVLQRFDDYHDSEPFAMPTASDIYELAYGDLPETEPDDEAIQIPEDEQEDQQLWKLTSAPHNDDPSFWRGFMLAAVGKQWYAPTGWFPVVITPFDSITNPLPQQVIDYIEDRIAAEYAEHMLREYDWALQGNNGDTLVRVLRGTVPVSFVTHRDETDVDSFGLPIGWYDHYKGDQRSTTMYWPASAGNVPFATFRDWVIKQCRVALTAAYGSHTVCPFLSDTIDSLLHDTQLEFVRKQEQVN